MATPEIAPTEAATEPAFEQLLELDLPVSAPSPLPQWALTAIAAIAAIVAFPPDAAFALLLALVEPLKTMPEGAGKAACRTAMRSKEAEIKAARAKLAEGSMPVMAPGPATERQSIPVVRGADEGNTAAPVLTAPVIRPGRWVPLMARGQGRLGLQSATERRSRATVDMWGARVEHAPQEPVIVGSLLRLQRANGAQDPRVKVVTAVVVTDGLSTVATVEDATPAQQAPQAAPMPLAPTIDTPSTVEASLTSIAETGAALASAQRETAFVAPTERGNGTSADSGASVGIFERPRAERVFRVAATETARNVRSLLGEREFIAGAVAAEGGMLQTSWDGGVRSQTTVAAMTDALMTIGREDDAPGVPSAEAYTGDAVASVSSQRGSISRRLPSRGLPDGISAKWQIGYVGATDVQAGDAFGSVALTVSLRDDDTLAFDGDLALANAVRSHYATSTAKEILRSDVLTAWLQRLLRRRHGAVKRGRVWYVPSGQAEAVEALVEAIQPLWGDHETIRVTTAKALAKSLSRGLSDELAKVAEDFAKQTAAAKERAQAAAIKKARELHNSTDEYVTAEGEAAFKRATVSSVVAARLLRDLGTVAARVAGYEVAIGSEACEPCKATIAALRTQLEKLTDDTSARAAMLELE